MMGAYAAPLGPRSPIKRDKKSLATAFAHSLGPMAFMGSPHDLGMQVTDRFFGNLSTGRNLTATLKMPVAPSSSAFFHW